MERYSTQTINFKTNNVLMVYRAYRIAAILNMANLGIVDHKKTPIITLIGTNHS